MTRAKKQCNSRSTSSANKWRSGRGAVHAEQNDGRLTVAPSQREDGGLTVARAEQQKAAHGAVSAEWEDDVLDAVSADREHDTRDVANEARQSGGRDVLSVEAVLDSCVATSTRKAYKSCLRVITAWIQATQDEPARFFDSLGVIDVNTFTSKHFEAFLLSRVNDDTKKVTVDTLSGYRSAVKDLYRKKKLTLPFEYGDQLKTFFSGLKRIEAEGMQSGDARDSGKFSLTYSKYEALCSESLRLSDGGFAHLFLATQWNLMCRSKSVQTLFTDHVSFHGDSIGCTFYKTKTNQEGGSPKDPRHVCANPYSPATCWMTTLGLYFACNPAQGPGALFPGSQQKNRFGKSIGCLLQKVGTPDKQYGTHSIRKGVATFACSGCIGGPSIYLGRVVAGLPLNKTEFAVLPPHFRDPKDRNAEIGVEIMFSKLHKEAHLRDVLKLCLASLAFHASWLVENLPKDHALLSTPLFRDPNLLKCAQDSIFTEEPSWIRASGVPPHIEMYKQQQKLLEAIHKLLNVLLTGISSLIEQNGVAAGNITRELLQSTIRKLIVDAGLVARHPKAPGAVERERQSGYYVWGGGIHILPEDFEFLSVNALATFTLWWLGNEAQKFPLFRMISTRDLSSRRKQKTFSKWKAMMNHIDDCIESSTQQRTQDNLTEEQLILMLTQIDLQLDSMTPKNRKRRHTQIKVTTAYRLLTSKLQKKKPQQTRLIE